MKYPSATIKRIMASICNALSRNNPEESSAKKHNAEYIENDAEYFCVSWMAADDSSIRCVNGGMHELSLQRMVDPLPDSYKQEPERHEKGVYIGNSADTRTQGHNEASCAKCHKKVIPVLNLKPGFKFTHNSSLK